MSAAESDAPAILRIRHSLGEPPVIDRVPRLLRAALALVALAALGAAGPASAAGQVHPGVHSSYASEDGAYGVGPRINVEVSGVEGLAVGASFDTYFPEEGGLWGLNGTATYSLLPGSGVSPYLGAGFSYMNESEEEFFKDLPGGGGIYIGGEESMTGVSVLGGLEFQVTDAVSPFGHVRYTTAGEGRYIVSAGILFF